MEQSNVESQCESAPIKKRSKDSNFAYVFRPVHYTSRIVGLLPFSFVYESNGEIKDSKIRIFDWFWFIMCISVYTLIIYSGLAHINLSKGPLDNTFIVYLGSDLNVITCFCSTVINIVYQMCNRSKLVEILKSFTMFDKEVLNFWILPQGSFSFEM